MAVAAGVAVGVAVPAGAHYANFTGSVYQTRDVPSGAERCILREAGVCRTHSWTFVSARALAGGASNAVCGHIWFNPDHNTKNTVCSIDFVRACQFAQMHDQNPINCHDQDGDDNRHVGVGTAFADPPEVIELHGGY